MAAASAAPTEYLTVAPLLVVVPPLSDDDPLEEDEPPDEEPPPDDELLPEPPPCTTLGCAAIALETAKTAIKINTAINFFINFILSKLRIIIITIDFKFF